MKTSIFSFFCVIANIACPNSPKVSENISEAQMKEAHNVAQNFLDALARNDSTAIFATFSGNPEGIYSVNGEFQKNVDMMPAAQQMFSGVLKQTFENVSDHYLFLSPTIFVYDYKSLNKMYEKTGVVTTIDPVCGSYTFNKEEGGWKLVHAHETWMNVTVDSSMVKK